jgi:RNA polymerase sigma factor (sigma-70 family)
VPLATLHIRVSGARADELLTENLALIERAVGFAARRYRLDPYDAEEFAAIVKLKLVENDYAVLRAYEARSAFGTYISVVVQRMALDYCIHAWGKWHPSAEAKRLGPLAIELEQLLRRDGRSLEEALTILGPKHDGVSRTSLQSLADRLPERAPRHRDVAIEKAESFAIAHPAEVEEPVMAKERRHASEHLSSIMSALIERLPEDERLILQLRFEGGMTVAQISRVLQLDQKLTYRRIDRCMREIKEELKLSGIVSADVLDLIGRDEALLRFDLGKHDPRPSKGSDERTQARSEGSQ